MADNPLEKVLSEEGYVRRLAKALVRDEHDIDDVVQEVWVAALKTPPKTDSVRSWLRTVVRNITVSKFRSDSARRRREEAVSRREGVPTVAEVQFQESVRKQVVAGMLQLPEMYREVLTLHFFRGMNSVQIGEQLGLPDSTVRTRCQRGLEQLRTHMDQAHGGDRRRWCLILAPYAGVTPESIPFADGSTTTATTTSSWWAQKQLGLGLLSATAIAVLGYLSINAFGTPEFEEALPSAPATTLITTPGPGSTATIKPAPLGTRHPVATAQPLRLLHANGMAAAGLKYWIHHGSKRPKHAGRINLRSTIRHGPSYLTGVTGDMESTSTLAVPSLLWIEITPDVLIAFETPDDSSVKDLLLPPLDEIQVHWPTTAAPPLWRVELTPFWPRGQNIRSSQLQNELFWNATGRQVDGAAERILVLPLDPARTNWACCCLSNKTRLVRNQTTAHFTTIRDARYIARVFVPGQLASPTWKQKLYVRAPGNVPCFTRGPAPGGELRLLDSLGQIAQLSGRYHLLDANSARHTHLDRNADKMLGRPIVHGIANLSDTKLAAHDKQGVYHLHITTNQGELFIRKADFQPGKHTVVPMRIGTGTQAVAIRSSSPAFRFNSSDRVMLSYQGGPFWRVNNFPNLKVALNTRSLSEDGSCLYSHQARPWDEAWVIQASGTVAIARLAAETMETTCTWYPARQVDPVDLRRLADEHGFGDPVYFHLEIEMPRSVGRRGKWTKTINRYLSEDDVLATEPLWHLTVPTVMASRISLTAKPGAPPVLGPAYRKRAR